MIFFSALKCVNFTVTWESLGKNVIRSSCLFLMDVTVLDKRGWTKHIWAVIFFFWKRFTLQAVKTRPTCMLEAQADLYFSRPPTPGLCLINYTAFGGFQICVKLWLIGEFFKMCVNLLLSSHFLYDKNAKKYALLSWIWSLQINLLQQSKSWA